MITETSSSSRAAPDRLFTRACGLVVAAGLALAAVSHALVGEVVRDQGLAAERAELSLDAAATARRIQGVLVSSGAPAALPLEARLDLHRGIAQLIDQERQRAETASAPDLARASADALTMVRRSELGPHDVARLDELLAARILPELDRAAREAADQANAAEARANDILILSLGLHLLLAALLVGAVVLPVRRRIRDWVNRTRQTDQENRFRLLHDALTHLPNATFLHAHLDQIIAGADRASTQTAVLRVDLDRFSILRDTLGQRTSDEIIRISARRIQHALRAGDFAAYLGHDDFVVVASELNDAKDAAAIAVRLQAALSQPFSIRGGARRLGVSVGVTLLSDDAANADRVIANAEIALAEAQGAGTGNVRYFRESLRIEVERRETLFTELLAGLDRGELVPFFQPQIDLETGGLSGFEALVRWMHPRHGLLTPAAFLEFAEQADLTERIGEVVLSRSLAALKDWDRAGLAVPRVGVNFALAQLRDPRLIEKIKWEVERNDLDPSRLAIEVLETVLIKSDADLVVRNLRGLASAGFHIELDDFGTGHASISNLRRFMVDRIKIDRSFIFGIETSEEQQQLAASMIAMAKALGISTLAEGVETEDAELILRRLGCDQFQGFLVAKPMSLADTMTWLRGFHPRRYEVPAAVLGGAGDPDLA